MPRSGPRPAALTTHLNAHLKTRPSSSGGATANLARMPANPLTDQNWATETTDTIVSVIDTVRTKTTTNVIYAARGVVFGLLAAIVGFFALLILLVGLMRGLQALLELGMTWERAVYVSYFLVGGVFSVAGIVLFKKRNSAAG